MRVPAALRALGGAALGRRGLLVLLGLDAALAWSVLLGIHTFLLRVWWSLAQRGVEAGALERHWAQVEAARDLHGLVWLVTAALFVAWVHRAWDRLGRAGIPSLRFTPRAAVAALLVPIANLVGGYRAVAGLWRAGEAPDEARASTVPTILRWWWGVFVAATLLGWPVLRLLPAGDARHALGWPTLRVVVGLLLEVAAAVLTIAVVWRTDTRVERLASRDRA
jgi:hypothetical protein